MKRAQKDKIDRKNYMKIINDEKVVICLIVPKIMIFLY